MLKPNLDGYHDPSRDLWREVEARTRRAIERGRKFADLALDSAEKLEEFQRHVREVVTAGIGGPIRASVRGSEGENFFLTDVLYPSGPQHYRVEKVLLTAASGSQIPVNIYVPATPGPHPGILFLAGHDGHGKAAAAYQEACALYAAAGFIVACFDPIGQGERHGYVNSHPPIAPGTTEHTYAGIPYWFSGTSLARYFLADADAVLNHLLSRPDVQEKRIIATGSSGGGMLTTLLMALEPRLAGAAPATYVTSRYDYVTSGARQDAEQILLGATDAGLDHDWLLAAMAPKPVCVLATNWDFFPIEGTIRTSQRAARAWKTLGASQDFQLVRVDTPHTYHRDMTLAAIDFFGPRFDLEPRESLKKFHPTTLTPTELALTPTGQIANQDANAVFAPEYLRREIEDRRREEITGHGGFGATPRSARTWLRERVFAHRKPIDANVRYVQAEGEWHAMWRNEENIWGAGVLLGTPGRGVETIVITDGDGGGGGEQAAAASGENARPGDGVTLILEVRGRGALKSHDRDGLPAQIQASSTYRIMTDLLSLDDSLAAAQVWDVLRAIDIFATKPVKIFGSGYGAYLAQLAAFCDDRIESLELEDEYVNPDAFVTKREYDTGRGAWHGVIPGIVHHAPWKLIRAVTTELRART